jgi:hypothetical protein
MDLYLIFRDTVKNAIKMKDDKIKIIEEVSKTVYF